MIWTCALASSSKTSSTTLTCPRIKMSHWCTMTWCSASLDGSPPWGVHVMGEPLPIITPPHFVQAGVCSCSTSCDLNKYELVYTVMICILLVTTQCFNISNAIEHALSVDFFALLGECVCPALCRFNLCAIRAHAARYIFTHHSSKQLCTGPARNVPIHGIFPRHQIITYQTSV